MLLDPSNALTDELIACPGNQTLEQRESLWISVAQTVNQPLLIRANESFPHPVRKWGLYNAVFVAVTAVSTIGMVKLMMKLSAALPCRPV